MIPTTMTLSATSTRYDNEIRMAQEKDELAQDILQALTNGPKTHCKVPLGECSTINKNSFLFMASFTGLTTLQFNSGFSNPVIIIHLQVIQGVQWDCF